MFRSVFTVVTLTLCSFTPTTAQTPPTLAQLRSVWQPGTAWTNTKNEKKAEHWRVDSFVGNVLTLSKPSNQGKGRVCFTLRVGKEGALLVERAAHVKTPTPADSRNHAGEGWIDRDALNFEMTAELKLPRKHWRPWNKGVHLEPHTRSAKRAPSEVRAPATTEPTVGTRLIGRRNVAAPSHGRGPGTIRGKVVKHDPRFLVIRAEESWPLEGGRTARATWFWRFQRDGRDENGAKRWRVKNGEADPSVRPNESTKHRFNWRGTVVWHDGKLEGRYWFDWRTMESKGLKPGSKKHMHPIILELEDANPAPRKTRRRGAQQ